MEGSDVFKPIGIDHIALTVPDVEEATLFFQQAFQASVLYDGHRPEDSAVEGEVAEAVFGMLKGGKWVHRRIISVGDRTNIELFQYHTSDQRQASRTFDYGLQHIGFLVEDLKQAADDFQAAGGKVYPVANPLTNQAEPVSASQGWVYGETPWGTVVELVTFPS